MALAARGAFVCVLPRRPSPTTTRPKPYLKQAFLSRRGGASLAVRAKDVDDYGALLSEKPAVPAPAKRDEWVGFVRDVSTVEKDDDEEEEEEEEEEVRSEQASLGVLNQIGVEESAALSLAKREGREGFGWNVSSTEKEEEEEEVQSEPASWDVLNQTCVELDSDKSYSALVYGTSAVVAVWISSIMVSALDSVPLVPQVMEVVGIGFTIWFTSRYLIFKENREELLTKVTSIKKQILGSHDG